MTKPLGSLVFPNTVTNFVHRLNEAGASRMIITNTIHWRYQLWQMLDRIVSDLFLPVEKLTSVSLDGKSCRWLAQHHGR